MTRPASSDGRPRPRLVLSISLVLVALILPLAAAPAAGVTRPVRLEAGPQVGYHFNADWSVAATKRVTLASPVAVSSDDRRWVSRYAAAYLHVSTGTFAGWWIRESTTAFVPGMLVTKTFSTTTSVRVGAGRYLAYQFDAAWSLQSTKTALFSVTSSAQTSRRVIINGRPYAQMTSGTFAGYWLPIKSPTVLDARPLSCSVPAKVPAGTKQVFRVLPGAVNQIALSFDMGGRLDPAMTILKRLTIEGVCATIFPTGLAAQTTIGRQVMAYIKAHPELFEVGNHTLRHCNFRDGGGGTASCPATRPTAAQMQKELTDAAAIIRSLTGKEPAPYWRPPYGAYDSGVLTAVAAIGYTKTMLWDIDTIDWRPVNATPTPGPTAGQIVDKVTTKAVNGSLVLMHLGGYNTFDALPSMIAGLRGRSLTPTTVSQILR